MHRTGRPCKGVVALKRARHLNLLVFSPNRGQTVWLVRVAGLAAESRLGMILGPLAPVIHIHSSVPVCTKVGTAWSSYYLEYQPTIYFSNNNNNSSSSRHTSESDVIDLDQSTSCSPLFSRSFRLNKIGLITPGVYFIYLHRNQVVVCGRGTAVTHFGFPCFAPSTQQLTLPIPWQYRYSRIGRHAISPRFQRPTLR